MKELWSKIVIPLQLGKYKFQRIIQCLKVSLIDQTTKIEKSIFIFVNKRVSI